MDTNAAEQGSFFSEIVKFALVALLIVVPIRFFVAQPFIVSGASMDPTFQNGDYLVVDELSYRFAEPERGDVVIFRYPADPSKFFIKRIIGLPDETVIIEAARVTIVNNGHPEGLVLDEPYLAEAGGRADFLQTRLDANEYFVLGDNRAASSDSRLWGALPRDHIVGRAFLRLLPITHIGVFPGAGMLSPAE